MPKRRDNSRVWPENPTSEKYETAPSRICFSRCAGSILRLLSGRATEIFFFDEAATAEVFLANCESLGCNK